ncbi:MAG: 1-acyl-sn-glycerol-3-phosphate acyltransferase [Gemmatimonadota bacterium]
MMTDVSLPRWLVLFLAVLAAWAVLDRILVPSVRWFIRQRTNRVLDQVRHRLRLEIRPFQQTKRQVLIDRLLFSPKVMEAVEAHAREEGMPRELAMARAERYAREIVPTFNAYLYFQVGYWLARRLAELLYRVRVGFVDESGLEGVGPDDTVIFVMNHRSNMDYVLVAYLAADRAALSYAVGEWARIWPFHMLIRSMGAYFVRRNSRNALYRRVLEGYVAMATEAGVTQAIYPEGGLTRDGLTRPPKLGLLEYMLRGFKSQGKGDLLLLPVGINYDRTLEDRTLLRDDKEESRTRLTARALGTTTSFLWRNLVLALGNRWYRFGYACVNFGAPISLRTFLDRLGVDDLEALSREERFQVVEALGQVVMEGVKEVIPVLPVSLVATVLVEDGQEPLTAMGLKARVERLIQKLEERGAHLYVPRKDRDYAFTVGLRMLTLRKVVVEEDGLYRPVAQELPLLRYYANAIRHHLDEAPTP